MVMYRVHGFPNADAPPCHSEHSEESHLEKEKKEIHRFALNDRRNALNDPPCHSEHSEESHLEKERDSSLRSE